MWTRGGLSTGAQTFSGKEDEQKRGHGDFLVLKMGAIGGKILGKEFFT